MTDARTTDAANRREGNTVERDKPTSGPASRGRVVMLIDNGVTGDSRVQKAARSAADAGWEVILLGRSPNGKPQSWQLGRAEVRLLPTPAPLNKRRHEFRRQWLRGPLAYSPTGVAPHRAQRVKAWQADLEVRLAEMSLDTRAGRPPGAMTKASVQTQMFAAGMLRRWVSLRYWQLTWSTKNRNKLKGPWDQTYTWFWRAVLRDRAWRRLEPGLWDWELAYGPVIDELAPDLIHAHDFRMLGVGARATVRARAGGRDVKLLWDAHEFVPGLNPRVNNARWLPAHVGYEREYVPYADAAVTVSEALAELLRKEHRLAERPAVVLNAPNAEPDEEADETPVPDLRALCGVDETTPLIAYCGGIAPVRGVDVMIEALPQLPEAHIALVSLPPGQASTLYIDELLVRARQLGVVDRVHVLPYVPHWQVAPFLAVADAAVSPLVHLPNHEIALSNKFFEYSHARLPMVVSDVRTMAETVRRTGQGEVFRAGDVADYVRAVRAVLADPERYRAAYDEPGLLARWTWEAQAEVLDGVYRRLLPGAQPDPAPTGAGPVDPPAARPADPVPPDAGIAPARPEPIVNASAAHAGSSSS